MMSSSKSKTIILISSDGETFEVEEAVALRMQTMIANVTGNTLAMVIDYSKRHAHDDLKIFDANFVKVDKQTLIDLALAANSLKIKSLLDLTCQALANLIKYMTPEEVCKTFNLRNDFTPEEEAEIRMKNAWAFE